MLVGSKTSLLAPRSVLHLQHPPTTIKKENLNKHHGKMHIFLPEGHSLHVFDLYV